MVKLQFDSNIDTELFPFTSNWDLTMRQNYGQYQNQIDKQTYQIQRNQRFWLAKKYPENQDGDLITLNLLKKKQLLGQINRQQLDLYKSIEPNIEGYFRKTFSVGPGLSLLGIATGAGCIAYTSYFNFTFLTRIFIISTPLLFDKYWNSRSTKSEVRCSEFFDWVIQYRKGKSFAERYNHLFKSDKLKKTLGDNNLIELGEQLVKLASN